MFYVITYREFMTSDLLSMTSYPLFRTSHDFMYDIKSTVSVLTSTASVSSHPTYRWHHSHYMEGITCSIPVITYPYVFDKISTKYDITTLCVDVTTLGICLTSFALHMTSHPLYHTKQRYLWCHIHFTHHNIPRYQTLHPLYLCHYNLSTDITPTFEWHHTHLLCDILGPI